MDHIGLAAFGTIRAQVASYCQQSDNTAKVQPIKDRINWNYFDAYQRHDWSELRRFHEGRHTHIVDGDNLTAYASSSLAAFQTSGYEAMPYDVGEIYSLMNGNPAGVAQMPPVLTKMDQAEFIEAISFNPSQSGVPEIWTEAGTTPLRRPLVVNEQLTLVSTSSSDTTSVRLIGITSAADAAGNYGLDQAETITLTGTTPLNSGLAYAKGWSILSVNILGALVGTVTIVGATSGITYVQLQADAGITDGPSFSSRKLIRMWPCPTSGTPYSLYYKRKCRKLVSDQDTPLWGIGPYLVEKSIADIYEQMRLPELAGNHHTKADQLLARMIQNEESSVMHMSRPQSIRGYMQGYRLVRPGP